MPGWGATHVLAYEEDGRMVEVLVRREGRGLYTVEEWAGHAVADWALRADGRISRSGETIERATLRPLPPRRISLDEVLIVALKLGAARGVARVEEVARALGRSRSEVEKSLETLRRLGKLEENR